MAVEQPVHSTLRMQTLSVAAPIFRPWRLAAGVAFGAAFATKWSGLYALLGAVVLSLFWETSRRRLARVPRPVWRAIQQEALGLVIAFLIVPVAVYLASYIGYFIERGADFGAFWQRQKAMFDFHSGLKAVNDQGLKTHPYESTPWSWILMLRPVSYYYRSPGAEVLGMGNPLVVWSGLATIPYLAYAWRKRLDWRAGFILVAIVSQYLVWFPFWDRVQFFFYMTPITPFFVLAAVYALKHLSEYRGRAGSYPLVPVVTGVVALSVAFFAFFYPVLTGWHLSYDAWHARMWLKGWI
jgi:dolichyl-phosphate-mannose--protein O-mannosyl transferase